MFLDSTALSRGWRSEVYQGGEGQATGKKGQLLVALKTFQLKCNIQKCTHTSVAHGADVHSWTHLYQRTEHAQHPESLPHVSFLYIHWASQGSRANLAQPCLRFI